MNRTVASSLASVLMASAFVAAQGAQTPPPTTPAASGSSTTSQGSATAGARVGVQVDKDDKDKDSKTVSLTGCLVKGSEAGVFLLENARTSAQGSGEAGKTYIIAKASTDTTIDFQRNLNHRVTVMGEAEEVNVIGIPSEVVVGTGGGSVVVGTQGTQGVTPSGSASGSTSSSSVVKDEKLLPKVTARSLTSLGSTCTAPAN